MIRGYMSEIILCGCVCARARARARAHAHAFMCTDVGSCVVQRNFFVLP